MLVICFGMLYKNGVIIHLSNLFYGVIIMMLGDFIYAFAKENGIMLFNNSKLTNIFFEIIRYTFFMFGFYIMLNFVRY